MISDSIEDGESGSVSIADAGPVEGGISETDERIGAGRRGPVLIELLSNPIICPPSDGDSKPLAGFKIVEFGIILSWAEIPILSFVVSLLGLYVGTVDGHYLIWISIGLSSLGSNCNKQSSYE